MIIIVHFNTFAWLFFFFFLFFSEATMQVFFIKELDLQTVLMAQKENYLGTDTASNVSDICAAMLPNC